MPGRPRARVARAVMLLGLLVLATSTASLAQEMPPEWREPRDAPHPPLRPGESPHPDDYTLADGYRLELVADELTYPTGVTFGPDGEVWVAESGYAYGPSLGVPRILRILDDGAKETVVRLPDGPVTDVEYHDGHLYAIGGRAPARVWRVDPEARTVDVVLTGFPSWGRHWPSQLAFGPDGRLYFAIGATTNAGVVGTDDYNTFGYLSIFPEARDEPCIPLRVAERDYQTLNPFSDEKNANATTGAFRRFGVPSQGERVTRPQPPPACNGAVFRASADGHDLEAFATGFRDVTGLAFGPDARLFAVNQGMLAQGSRPVANDCDAVWVVERDAWYGFPDHPCGMPVADPRFVPENRTAPEPLLLEPPPLAGEPFHRFDGRVGAWQLAVPPSGAFANESDLFVAEHGAYFTYPPPGHAITRIDTSTGEAHAFYANLRPGPNGTAPERPTGLAFTRDGEHLYVTDFGRLVTTTGVFHPSALTGRLWRISTEDAENGARPAGVPDADAATGPMAGVPAPAPVSVLAAVGFTAFTIARHKSGGD